MRFINSAGAGSPWYLPDCSTPISGQQFFAYQPSLTRSGGVVWTISSDNRDRARKQILGELGIQLTSSLRCVDAFPHSRRRRVVYIFGQKTAQNDRGFRYDMFW
jgi:hypothetical protein